MATKHFEVGDRMRARISIHGVPMGTSGTIRRVLGWADDLYDVEFDNHPRLYAVRGTDLEPLDQEIQEERTA